jgi:hypothetical protein
MAKSEGQPISSLDDVQDMISKNNLLMAAQELNDSVPEGTRARYLLSIFGDPAVRPTDNHAIIPQLPLRAVLTTNYDSLIEQAYSIATDGAPLSCLTQEDLASRPCPIREGYFFIFKLHGDFQRVKTVVLSSRDYQRWFYREPLYRSFLERVFADFTLIFVGFGGSDPDIDDVLNKLAALSSSNFDPHFLVLPRGRLNATERKRLLLDRRLQVLEYDHDPEHTQLGALLRELLSRCLFTPATPPSAGLRVMVRSHPADCEVVERVCLALNDSGHGYNRAEVSNQYQRDGRSAMRSRVRLADCVLSLFSPDSFIELDTLTLTALEENKYVIPILLRGASLPRLLAQTPAIVVSSIDELIVDLTKELALVHRAASALSCGDQHEGT